MSEVMGWKSKDPNDQDFCMRVLQVLWDNYPGWSWFAEIQGDMLIIRNYSLDWTGKWCMARRLKDLQSDHARMTHQVKTAAGEFLERAHVRRGPRGTQNRQNVLEGAYRWKPPPGTLIN